MPKKRYARKRKRSYKRQFKRRVRRRRNRRTAPVLTQKSGGGFPFRASVKLPYYGHIRLNSGTAFSNHTFNLNSINDPDRTGTGKRPAGYDELALIYGLYEVRAVKFTAVFYNSSAIPVNCYMVCAQDQGLATSVNKSYTTGPVRNTARSRAKMISAYGAGDRNRCTVSMYINTRRWYPEIYQDNTARSGFGSNPSRWIPLVVGAQSLDATTAADVYVDIKVKYYCLVYQQDTVQTFEMDAGPP